MDLAAHWQLFFISAPRYHGRFLLSQLYTGLSLPFPVQNQNRNRTATMTTITNVASISAVYPSFLALTWINTQGRCSTGWREKKKNKERRTTPEDSRQVSFAKRRSVSLTPAGQRGAEKKYMLNFSIKYDYMHVIPITSSDVLPCSNSLLSFASSSLTPQSKSTNVTESPGTKSLL